MNKNNDIDLKIRHHIMRERIKMKRKKKVRINSDFVVIVSQSSILELDLIIESQVGKLKAKRKNISLHQLKKPYSNIEKIFFCNNRFILLNKKPNAFFSPT